jgi:hypothetical protein
VREPFATWEAAARLAEQLAATPAFGTGLRLHPEGEAVADRLDLAKRAPVQTVLRAKSPPPLALGLEELRSLRGLAAKARFVARKLLPSPSYMRVMTPTARRGPAWLFAAYCRRMAWMLRHAGPAVRAWKQSRREASRL